MRRFNLKNGSAGFLAILVVQICTAQQYNLPADGIKLHERFYNINPPSVDYPIDYSDSIVVVLERNKTPLQGHVPNEPTKDDRTTIDVNCTVAQSGIKGLSPNLSILFGSGQKPDANYKPDPPVDRSKPIPNRLNAVKLTLEQQFGRTFLPGDRYLAVLTLPSGRTWKNPGHLIPRFLMLVTPQFKLEGGSDKGSILKNLFSLVLNGPVPEEPNHPGYFDDIELKYLFHWLFESWNAADNRFPVTDHMIPGSTNERPNFTPDPLAENIASDALELASNADPTSKIYLTRIAGLWGGLEPNSPFFLACQYKDAKAKESLLMNFGAYGGQHCLTWKQGLELSKEVEPSLAYYVLRFSDFPKEYTKQEKIDLFLMSKRLGIASRESIYAELTRGMTDEEHTIFNVWRNGNGIEGGPAYEAEYRQKWEIFLGIPHDNAP